MNDFDLGGVGSKQLSRALHQLNRWPAEYDAIAAATELQPLVRCARARMTAMERLRAQ